MPEAKLPMSVDRHSALDLDREEEIGELVDRFYDVARRDAVLGPVFERRVSDWDRHLSTMRDFWSSAVYRTGRYSGRPLEAHRSIPEIQAEHFPRWLGLWRRTVDEVVRSDAHGPLKELAARMASAMSSRLDLARSDRAAEG